EWQVLIKEHHEGYLDWRTFEGNQVRLAGNTRPGPHKAGGAVREGSALLQSLGTCGHCGRRLKTHYSGRNAAPGYHCAGKIIVEGRGSYCLTVGGVPQSGPPMRPSARSGAIAPSTQTTDLSPAGSNANGSNA